MTSKTWLEYLKTQGGVTDSASELPADIPTISHFGNPSAERESAASGDVMADLSHYALLEISGEDAETFLQGQVTSDVRETANSLAQYSSHCTAKGRMLASFLLWRENKAFRLMLPATLVTDTQKRLSMYIMRSKVNICQISEQVVLMGAAGPNTPTALGALFNPVPSTCIALTTTSKGTLIHLGHERFVIACPVTEAPHIWESLRSNLTPVGSNRWDWLDICNNIPVIYPQTRESFIPNMVHLDKLGGIGLNKGCYVGQEVIARAHYLGKIKRHMVLAHLNNSEQPLPGDSLCLQGGDGKTVGEVVSAQASQKEGYDLLAVIKDENAEDKVLCWKTADGPVISLISPQPEY